MRCHNYAHSDEEITRIHSRATSQRGYVDGSWIQADAGHDGFGGRLTLCSWRWASPPLCQHGECMADAVHGQRVCARHGEHGQQGERVDLVRGCAS